MEPEEYQWTRCVGDDLQHVVAIESCPYDRVGPPWTVGDFLKYDQGHNSSIGVVKFRNRVFGFCAFSWDASNYTIHNMAVHPAARRLGLGTFMINKLKMRFETAGRPGRKIQLLVMDCNQPFIHFLQSKVNQFRAVGVLHDHFGLGIDGYQFVWVCGEGSPVFQGKNRITKFYLSGRE